jgi:hypothetical protein
MTRKIVVAACLALTIGVIWWSGLATPGRSGVASETGEVGAASGGDGTGSEVRGAKAVRPAGEAEADPTAAQQAGAAADTIEVREERVIALYTSMAKAYEDNSSDCEAVGKAMARVVAEQGASARVMADEHQRLSPEEKRAYEAAFMERHGAELEKFRSSLGAALRDCPGDRGLRNALQNLGQVGASG